MYCNPAFDPELGGRPDSGCFKLCGRHENLAVKVIAPKRTSAQQLKQDLMQQAQTAIKQSGMTHQQVADIIGVSRQRISSLVGGQDELFSIEYLMNFLEEFGERK